MKKLLTLTAAVVVLAGSSVFADGAGSAFGALTTARTMGMGNMTLGGAVGIADATTVFGQLNYGLSDDFDGRLRMGLLDPDGPGDAEFTFGADLKYQIWRVGTPANHPVELAMGGMFEYIDNIWQLGGFGLVSYPTKLKNNMTLSPYGRLNVRLEHYSWGGESDSEIKFGLNAGVLMQLTESINAYGEFQIDGNDGLFLGLDFFVL